MSRSNGPSTTVENWETIADLTTNQIKSVDVLQEASSRKPIPKHLVAADSAAAETSKPLQIEDDVRPPADAGTIDDVLFSQLSLDERVATTQQFHNWFTRVSDSMDKEQETVYTNHLNELGHYVSMCDEILDLASLSRGLLAEIESNYKFVIDNSSSLQTACENMLDEQKHLSQVSEALQSRLQYFNELESATRILNRPGEALVLEDSFLNMLDRVDVCMEYLKENRDFKDAEIYIIRYQQCLARALTLIKMFFTSHIRKVVQQVNLKMTNNSELSDTARNALLYTKFAKDAPAVHVLMFELEKRVYLDQDEYATLLSDCYTMWFYSRSGLVMPYLLQEIKAMEPATSDLVKLTRSGCNYIRSLCIAEWTLYKEYFSTGEKEIYTFLSTLCRPLFDALRPRINRENRIETLSEVYTIISALRALDTENDEDEDDESTTDISKGTNSDNRVPTASSSHLKFGNLLQGILMDTQKRLLSRVKASGDKSKEALLPQGLTPL